MREYDAKLLHLSDLEEGKRRGSFYYGDTDVCDICSTNLSNERFFIDGTKRGSLQWANMCPECFSSMGTGIGWGMGQLYMKQPDGEWLMTAGFDPNEQDDE